MIDNPSATYFTLVKSLLRPDNADEAQKESARAACSWLNDQIGQVRRYTEGERCTLLGLVWEHWVVHKEGPNQAIIDYQVGQLAEPALSTLFADFKETDMADHTGWVHHEPDDLPALWSTLVEEAKVTKTVKLMSNAIIVATKGVELQRNRTKVLYKGPDAAIKYVWEMVDGGAMSAPGGIPTHGSLSGNAERVVSLYEESVQPEAKGKAQKTGLQQLDAVTQPRSGQLIGVAGYAKSGKTRFGRTWNYHSICEGMNVLHLTYEQSFDEELQMYAIIHSHNKTFFPDEKGISYEKYAHQALTREELVFLKHVVADLRDHKSIPGQLLLRQPQGDASWGDAMIQATLANTVAPLDRLWIDYLTAITVTDRDEKAAYNTMIQNAKSFAMNFDNGKGLCVATPFQINRDSWEKAGGKESKEGKESDDYGRYESNCCYMYSQVEKAVDILYYVYGDDKLTKDNLVILGTCIDRHWPTVAPFRAAVEHNCGTFHNYKAKMTETDVERVMALPGLELL